MLIQILNSFSGDKARDVDTSTAEGREAAAKLVSELLGTGAAIFLEREVDGDTKTYRVTGYDAATDRLKITLPIAELEPSAHADPIIEGADISRPKGRRGRRPHTVDAHIPSNAGRAVSVAPVSGGLDVQVEPEPLVDGQGITWEGVRRATSLLCEERGWHHGCPLPSSTAHGARLVVAKGAPMHDQMVAGMFLDFGLGKPDVRLCRNEDIDEDPAYRVNSWTPRVTRVDVYRDSKGSYKSRIPYVHERLMMWIRTQHVRAGACAWQSEITAMLALQAKLSESQWASYVLSGCFPETSSRSRVTYILRRGLPTLAITQRPRPDGMVQTRFLTALCLHPLAYYEDTWAGAQPPSDEVIAHLMLIRSDEHFLWRKSGQHGIEEARAAV